MYFFTLVDSALILMSFIKVSFTLTIKILEKYVVCLKEVITTFKHTNLTISLFVNG